MVTAAARAARAGAGRACICTRACTRTRTCTSQLERELAGKGDGDEVPQIQRQALLEAGVPDESIELIPDEAEAIQAALEGAKPGDLLLLFGDDIARCWEQITTFRPGAEVAGEHRSQGSRGPGIDLEDRGVDAPSFDATELVRDERGVRLARLDEPAD